MQELFRPSEIQLPCATAEDERIGHLLADQFDSSIRIAILGFPVDEGVQRNGGRQGAALAPKKIRDYLYRMTPDAADPGPFASLLKQTFDLGDLRCKGDLAQNQQSLGNAIAQLLSQDPPIIPILLGGGHETAYGHFLGYVHADRKVRIVNFDAHTDVRLLIEGKPHSGSPFRQAMEHVSGACEQYCVAGLNRHTVAHAHVQYVQQNGGQLLWQEQVHREKIDAWFAKSAVAIMASFDLDALPAADAPGVSAPNAAGLERQLWIHAAHQAGACESVQSMDIVELCPPHDIADQTARLAALTIWHFLSGVSKRKQFRSIES